MDTRPVNDEPKKSFSDPDHDASQQIDHHKLGLENYEEGMQFVNEGKVVESAGRFKAAVFHYNQAIELDPTNQELYRQIELAYKALEKYGNAHFNSEQAAEFYYQRGIVGLAQAKYAKDEYGDGYIVTDPSISLGVLGIDKEIEKYYQDIQLNPRNYFNNEEYCALEQWKYGELYYPRTIDYLTKSFDILSKMPLPNKDFFIRVCGSRGIAHLCSLPGSREERDGEIISDFNQVLTLSENRDVMNLEGYIKPKCSLSILTGITTLPAFKQIPLLKSCLDEETLLGKKIQSGWGFLSHAEGKFKLNFIGKEEALAKIKSCESDAVKAVANQVLQEELDKMFDKKTHLIWSIFKANLYSDLFLRFMKQYLFQENFECMQIMSVIPLSIFNEARKPKEQVDDKPSIEQDPRPTL